VTSVTDGQTEYEYTYDENGNIETRIGPGVGSPGVTTFEYNYKGSRVKKTADGTTTVYINNLYECTGSGQNQDCEKHIFAGSRRIATKKSTGTFYYHPDHLGGLNVATGSSGALAQRNFYYPYGETGFHGAAQTSTTNSRTRSMTPRRASITTRRGSMTRLLEGLSAPIRCCRLVLTQRIFRG